LLLLFDSSWKVESAPWRVSKNDRKRSGGGGSGTVLARAILIYRLLARPPRLGIKLEEDHTAAVGSQPDNPNLFSFVQKK
jgi:hypothetical protein